MKFQMEGREIYNIFDSADKLSTDEAVVKFKDDRWLMKGKDGSNTILFAVMVPEDAMKQYQKRGIDRIGARFGPIKDFTPKNSQLCTFEFKDSKLHATDGDFSAKMPTTAINAVKYPVEKVPSVDAPIVIQGDLDKIMDAVTRIENITGTDHVFISARENNIYVWGKHDASSADKVIPMEEFDNKQVDWSKASDSEIADYDAEKDKRTETIMSIELLKSIKQIADEGTFYLGNHNPMKFVFESEAGVKMSWIITPRIPSPDKRSSIPQEIIEPEDK